MPGRYFHLHPRRTILKSPPINRKPAMSALTTSQTIKQVNFFTGFALLVMLFPHGGKLPEKPAGVRTAIELVSKKTSAGCAVAGVSQA
jgi:hypothetical protein